MAPGHGKRLLHVAPCGRSFLSWGLSLMMKSGMELRRLEDDYKAMVVQTIDITD
jgi:hypothetical protein